MKKKTKKKTKGISFFTVNCIVQSTVKGLKRKREKKKKTKAHARVNFFSCIKNIKKG